MNDDLATPQVISNLFEACTVVNRLIDHKGTICADCLKELTETMHLFAEDILGLSMVNGQCSKMRLSEYKRMLAFSLSNVSNLSKLA